MTLENKMIFTSNNIKLENIENNDEKINTKNNLMQDNLKIDD